MRAEDRIMCVIVHGSVLYHVSYVPSDPGASAESDDAEQAHEVLEDVEAAEGAHDGAYDCEGAQEGAGA